MARGDNKMGKWGATSYIIGNIVGSGIFITPSEILRGASSIGVALIIWVISAVIAMLGAYCYVELGTSIRKSGADFAYLCHVKWKPVAFSFMFGGCILAYPATLAIQGATFSEYIIEGLQIEVCDENVLFLTKKLIAFTIIWLLLFLNFFSVKTVVARFQIFASIAKVSSTSIVIATGFYFLIFKGMTQNIAHPFANIYNTVSVHNGTDQVHVLGNSIDTNVTNVIKTNSSLINAFFAGLFSYDGWDVLNFGTEEIDNPKIAMPFAILLGTSLTAIIYLLMNISFFIVLSSEQILKTSAIGTTFATYVFGQFSYVIPFLVSIVLVGSLNGTLFSASRYLFASSRARQFPSFMSCINAKHDSPRPALFFHVLLAMAFTFVGDLNQLISYVGFTQWFQRSLTMCALLYIRFWHKPVHPEAIRRFSWYRCFSSYLNDRLCIFVQIIFNGMVEVDPIAPEKNGGEKEQNGSGPNKAENGLTHRRVFPK
ncbi:amino acid permease domain-containing protein [Ditylenchus destructor]|uniref:Amino acid permease domain-containing protein n=1 Tax=Ditylenchus destructor TaxID=166010 RepID=A0AAD4N7V5_9BILA|nr:amino acid permease domain-containing protein [Ditylenchus destructor]